MSLNSPAQQCLTELYPQMVKWRRHLHQHPELSYKEQETSEWIAAQLAELPCEIRRNVGGHGIVATLRGRETGPIVALRADMDALPIQDEKQTEYASKVPGVMHACGHDGHTAALLAVARYYAAHPDSFAGERRLLFQPAEEVTPGGAKEMVGDGALQDVDVIYGVHLWTPLPYGTLSTKPGPFMSAADEFEIEIEGLGGHGGLPHQSIDTIMIGAALVQALQSIVSRSINPLHPAVVTIGSFQAGTTNNVIAEKCRMKGTIRTFDENSRKLAHERLETIIKHICEMHGARHRLHMKIGYPAVVNDEREASRFFEVAKQLVGEEHAVMADAITVAEDFSYYLERVPGCFMFVGAGNPDCGAEYAHHHAKFDIDERAMLHSAALLIGMAEHYAGEKK
ncbi:amidohydrolase [Paenibacillus sp. HB172176]|uniref:amidohydrolase n=1 Tax=Paenibacillus sp. HB172176 TaxID=2493690 RepID=UPI00143B03BE|nr:amidohydrolase [Paenibacillus sp. HB172176]